MENKVLTLKKDGKKIAEICFFLDNPTKEKEKFISNITDKIIFRNDIGFAGYKDKDSLKKFLQWFIYGNTETKKTKTWNQLTISECMKEIESVLRKCTEVIQDKIIKIFVFPTIDAFVIEKMGGVSGFTPWKNTIILGVFGTDGRSKSLQNTICHELAHAISLNFNNRDTLGDDLVFEGVAEHFREDILGGGKSPWVQSISEREVKQIFQEIKPKLKISSDELYCELFFGTGKFPLWSGYAIGYYLVGAYLNKCSEKNWIRIIKERTSEILKKSDYLSM